MTSVELYKSEASSTQDDVGDIFADWIFAIEGLKRDELLFPISYSPHMEEICVWPLEIMLTWSIKKKHNNFHF